MVGYQTDQFDNLNITPGTGSVTVPTGPVTSGIAGKCLDDYTGSATDGTKVDLWDCNGTPAQNWTVGNGLVQINGKCLDSHRRRAPPPTAPWSRSGTATAAATRPGPPRTAPWSTPPRASASTTPTSSTTNGTQLEIWTCNGGTNQQWTLP